MYIICARVLWRTPRTSRRHFTFRAKFARLRATFSSSTTSVSLSPPPLPVLLCLPGRYIMVSLARPPEGLFDVVKHAVVTHAHDKRSDREEEHPSTPPLAQPPVEDITRFNQRHDPHPQGERPWKDDQEGRDVKSPPDKPPDVSLSFRTLYAVGSLVAISQAG
ncbi:hypothetical protein BD413DRAFT_551495 [Trametes elegans]|nr:hypothetical protein BD413DRAFT_551495 [Trametes elegans]